jgi:hypothetical protein
MCRRRLGAVYTKGARDASKLGRSFLGLGLPSHMAPPPPEMQDMSAMMDRMMESVMQSPPITFTVELYEMPSQEAPHFMID